MSEDFIRVASSDFDGFWHQRTDVERTQQGVGVRGVTRRRDCPVMLLMLLHVFGLAGAQRKNGTNTSPAEGTNNPIYLSDRTLGYIHNG